MATSDLIRLATELDEAGGMHRLTSLINCAVRRCLEHERGGEETGVVCHNGTPVLHCVMKKGPCVGGCYEYGWCKADPNPPPGMLRNPAPQMALNGERKQLPQSDCQDEYPRGISHAPDSPLFALAQSDFGRRLVPRRRPVDPTIAAEDPA